MTAINLLGRDQSENVVHRMVRSNRTLVFFHNDCPLLVCHMNLCLEFGTHPNQQCSQIRCFSLPLTGVVRNFKSGAAIGAALPP